MWTRPVVVQMMVLSLLRRVGSSGSNFHRKKQSKLDSARKDFNSSTHEKINGVLGEVRDYIRKKKFVATETSELLLQHICEAQRRKQIAEE